MYPWESHNIDTLKRTICAFLNTSGGVIYIGIHETS
jgi:predicted HTH transcriptional regulator